MRPSRLLASLGCAGLLAACGGDSNDGQIDVNLEYPTEGARTITGSVHVWVLQSSAIDDSEEPPPGCAALVGDIADPYDVAFQRFFDDVFLQPDEPSPVAEGLPGGSLLVYVEAVDYTGITHLAGCALSEGSGSVTVQLVTPATFDCGDAATEEGARCDDGDLCTVGETCRGSSCQGGVARDCTFAADGCNAAACDSAIGCVTTPLTGPACDDSLFCSTSEVCMEGACIGAATDCSFLENGCRSGICNEDFNSCQPANFPNLTPCDLFCRVPIPAGSTPLCNGSGTCNGGTTRNCNDDCNIGSCNETFDRCDTTPRSPPPATCNDGNACTVNESCNAAGVCGNGVLKDTDGDNYSPVGCPPDTNGAGDCNDNDATVNPGQVEGPMGNATCSNGKDDDCDGLMDAADNQGPTNCTVP